MRVLVKDKERAEFRSWPHRHDPFVSYSHRLKELSRETVSILLTGDRPSLSYVRQEPAEALEQFGIPTRRLQLAEFRLDLPPFSENSGSGLSPHS